MGGRPEPHLREAGLAAMVAGVAHVAQGAFLLWQPRQSHWTDSDYVAYLLFAVGVVAALVVVVLLAQSWRGHLRAGGRVGIVVAVVGLVALAVTSTARMIAAREVGDLFFGLGFLAMMFGYAVLGIAFARARLLRTWEALLPLFGVLGALVLQDAHGAGMWLGGAWLLFGTRLIRRASQH
jgi:hypothetical protein